MLAIKPEATTAVVGQSSRWENCNAGDSDPAPN